ncbi:MAG: efflux RND transporter periplasmic adaptor subunit [Gemmata sp.]
MSAVTLPVTAQPAEAAGARPWVRLVVPLVCLAVGAGGGAAAALALARPAAPAAAEPAQAKEEPTAVTFARDKWSAAGIRTEPAAAAPLADHVWRTGRVVLDDGRVARVSPPIEGVVVEVRAKLGQDVPAGAVLAVIDSREVGGAKLEFARARLAAAAERERAGWAATSAANTAELVKAVAADKPAAEIETAFRDKPVGEKRQALMTAYAQRNHLRTHVSSLRASGGAVAAATVQKAEAESEGAEASLRALLEEFRAQADQQARQAGLKLKEADAALAAARTHLLTLGYAPAELDKLDPAAEGAAASRYEIKAPFAGTVVDRHGVRAERVGPQTEMFRLADLSAVWVQADVFEGDLPLVRAMAGRGVEFRAPAAGVAQQPGEVVYAGDIVDRASRTLTLTAAAPNPKRELKPGMFVEVGLPRGGPEPVLSVPAAAVQRHQGRAFVFVHTGDDEFRRADVELGREGGDRVEIKSGLAPGAAVVVDGGFVLKSELLRDQLAGE